MQTMSGAHFIDHKMKGPVPDGDQGRHLRILVESGSSSTSSASSLSTTASTTPSSYKIYFPCDVRRFYRTAEVAGKGAKSGRHQIAKLASNQMQIFEDVGAAGGPTTKSKSQSSCSSTSSSSCWPWTLSSGSAACDHGDFCRAKQVGRQAHANLEHALRMGQQNTSTWTNLLSCLREVSGGAADLPTILVPIVRDRIGVTTPSVPAEIRRVGRDHQVQDEDSGTSPNGSSFDGGSEQIACCCATSTSSAHPESEGGAPQDQLLLEEHTDNIVSGLASRWARAGFRVVVLHMVAPSTTQGQAPHPPSASSGIAGGAGRVGPTGSSPNLQDQPTSPTERSSQSGSAAPEHNSRSSTSWAPSELQGAEELKRASSSSSVEDTAETHHRPAPASTSSSKDINNQASRTTPTTAASAIWHEWKRLRDKYQWKSSAKVALVGIGAGAARAAACCRRYSGREATLACFLSIDGQYFHHSGGGGAAPGNATRGDQDLNIPDAPDQVPADGGALSFSPPMSPVLPSSPTNNIFDDQQHHHLHHGSGTSASTSTALHLDEDDGVTIHRQPAAIGSLGSTSTASWNNSARPPPLRRPSRGSSMPLHSPVPASTSAQHITANQYHPRAVPDESQSSCFETNLKPSDPSSAHALSTSDAESEENDNWSPSEGASSKTTASSSSHHFDGRHCEAPGLRGAAPATSASKHGHVFCTKPSSSTSVSKPPLQGYSSGTLLNVRVPGRGGRSDKHHQVLSLCTVPSRKRQNSSASSCEGTGGGKENRNLSPDASSCCSAKGVFATTSSPAHDRSGGSATNAAATPTSLKATSLAQLSNDLLASVSHMGRHLSKEHLDYFPLPALFLASEQRYAEARHSSRLVREFVNVFPSTPAHPLALGSVVLQHHTEIGNAGAVGPTSGSLHSLHQGHGGHQHQLHHHQHSARFLVYERTCDFEALLAKQTRQTNRESAAGATCFFVIASTVMRYLRAGCFNGMKYLLHVGLEILLYLEYFGLVEWDETSLDCRRYQREKIIGKRRIFLRNPPSVQNQAGARVGSESRPGSTIGLAPGGVAAHQEPTDDLNVTETKAAAGADKGLGLVTGGGLVQNYHKQTQQPQAQLASTSTVRARFSTSVRNGFRFDSDRLRDRFRRSFDPSSKEFREFKPHKFARRFFKDSVRMSRSVLQRGRRKLRVGYAHVSASFRRNYTEYSEKNVQKFDAAGIGNSEFEDFYRNYCYVQHRQTVSGAIERFLESPSESYLSAVFLDVCAESLGFFRKNLLGAPS